MKRALNREWKGKGRRLWKAELSENNEDTRGNLTPGPSSPRLLAFFQLVSLATATLPRSLAECVEVRIVEHSRGQTKTLATPFFFFFDLSLFPLLFCIIRNTIQYGLLS